MYLGGSCATVAAREDPERPPHGQRRRRLGVGERVVEAGDGFALGLLENLAAVEALEVLLIFVARDEFGVFMLAGGGVHRGTSGRLARLYHFSPQARRSPKLD